MSEKPININSNTRRIVFKNGNTYDGEVNSLGHMHGNGVFQWLDPKTGECDSRYEGSFRKNMRHGQGRYFFEHCQLLYVNTWANDIQNAEGTVFLVTTGPGRRSEGVWDEQLLNGEGTIWFANGDRYDGKLRNGMITTGKYYDNHGAPKYVYVRGRLDKPSSNQQEEESESDDQNDD